MTQRITVVPAEGRAVPDPEAGDLLPVEGRQVTLNAWWQRRQNDGDITIQTEQTPTTYQAFTA
ncbi:DUF2635 domain-containing protein [Pseudomonas syringae pv. actinidiae]|uniref:DUF2635 domain-containing protein n=3 Tax=Pseudomonas syringae group TaxID=136849 RepID=A0A0K8M0X2_PSESF|nr:MULTISPECIES: DUF2635 domain-containing protein [Pseudomonas syringae group]EPN56379.1 hypothetical protein A235_35118 [Pseudomonas syringae pv. actinidiae ICMP 19079]EPN86127.1 hypothetical protein A234_03371 [Pseudomonas syringae pv. actinidiae ICMP 19101]AKT28388.1 hypothetical protein IYO_002465 [Pseudomonas syringae pv. actinidiae ICMP 18884]AOE54935.1 hypothetical protein NZ708_02465 [Pseudomonas syringae pv. actinidiae ICMP 18708]APP95797.1 DUF2635 domain-containing protein [Pseudomo